MPPTTIHVRPPGIPDIAPPAVETRDLARLFDRQAALAGVSIRVEPGRCIGLVGPNGAGKTTLLRVLATALRPSFGSAAVDGIDVAERADQVRPRVAYMPHTSALYDDLTALENLRFAATMLGVPAADLAQRVTAALERVGLGEVATARVGTFSAGMRRRLVLGRLLLGRPRLVLLDEPFAAVDAAGMDLVGALVDHWRAAGVTVLVASHAADRLADRLDGQVQLEGGLVVDLAGSGVSPSVTAAPASARPLPALPGA